MKRVEKILENSVSVVGQIKSFDKHLNGGDVR